MNFKLFRRDSTINYQQSPLNLICEDQIHVLIIDKHFN